MNAESVWRDGGAALPEGPGGDEVCAMARRREREEVLLRRGAALTLVGLAAAFAHNAWQIRAPWVRFGQGWMLIAMTALLFLVLRKRSARRGVDETCATFLLRSLERKRDGYRAARYAVLVAIPGAAASWWGGGAALKARALGLNPSSAYYRYLTGPGPMIASCVVLVLVWLAFGAAARNADGELEEMRRRVSL